MQKLFWVRLPAWDAAQAQTALEQGANALVLPAGCREKVAALGKIELIAPDGDRVLGRDVADILLREKADEERAAAAGVPVIVANENWSIIPLENLIAAGATVLQTVHTAEEARLALTTMEVGAAGICLLPANVQTIIDTAAVVREVSREELPLTTVAIESVEPAGLADRVCVDTTSLLPPGRGLLVGDSSAAMLLVHNENVANEYVNARPFRVNAGAVHAYVRLPASKTAYLSEVAAGTRVLTVDSAGRGEAVTVGRAKVERRPMLLVRARAADGRTVSLQLQNAETIRLTRPSGEWISVVELKAGDEVLAYFEAAGRHFGMAIKETITEK